MVFASQVLFLDVKRVLTFREDHSGIVMNNKLILMGISVVTAISIAIGNSSINLPSAKAIGGIPCSQCAKDFAPRQLTKDSWATVMAKIGVQ